MYIYFLVILFLLVLLLVFLHFFSSLTPGHSAQFGSPRGGNRIVCGSPVSNGAVELPSHRALHGEARHRAHGLGEGLHEHRCFGSVP